MIHKASLKGSVSDFDYDIFSLPRAEVRILAKTYVADDSQKTSGSAILDVECITKKHQCPKCGSWNTQRVGKQYEVTLVNHMMLSNYVTLQLRLHKRRFECLDCKKGKGPQGPKGTDGSSNGSGSTFLERVSFMNLQCTYTATFAHFITREWEYQSLEELARKFHVSASVIYDCIDGLDVGALVQGRIGHLESLSSVMLGVDEFSFRGQNYMLQITELRSRKVVGILTSATKEALEAWCYLLPLTVLQKIEGIASDMNASYKKTIQDCIRKRLKEHGLQHSTIPEIQIKELGIVDHFHLKQMMMKTVMEVHSMNNWMIKAGHYDKKTKDLFLKETKHFNKYRTVVPWSTENTEKATQSFANATDCRQHLPYTPKDPTYKAITLGHFLSCKYQSLLLMSEDKLTTNQQHRLNQILHEFDPRGYLKEIYCAKELFFEALKGQDSSLLTKVIEDMVTSLQYKIETCGKTLKKWKQCILNFFSFDNKINNAFTEGKNTKVKLMKRMAYGYRNKENFQKRLLLCL